MHAQRGQALLETAIFLPVALMVLFAILYFARFGVLEERAQTAVRYGATVSYEAANPPAAAQIYATLAANAAPSGTCPPSVATDTLNALDGAQSGAQAQGFWKPDSLPSATCTVSVVGFTSTKPDAFRYLTVTTHTVGGSLDVPAYIAATIGAHGNVTASLGMAHPDPPGIIMYCTAHVGAAVAAALNATYTATGNC